MPTTGRSASSALFVTPRRNFSCDNPDQVWTIDSCVAFCADNDFLLEDGLTDRLLTLKKEQDAPTPCRAAQSVALPLELMTKAPPEQNDLDREWKELLERVRDIIATVLVLQIVAANGPQRVTTTK